MHPALLLAAFSLHCVSTYASPSCVASSIPKPQVSGALVTSLTAAPIHNYIENLVGENNNWNEHNTTGLSFCQVNVTLTHPGTGDSVNNQVWLPLSGWNGIFLGVGGGGYAAGTWSSLGAAIVHGYAAVSTDAGHSQNNSGDASAWALVSEGNVNQYLLLDFASRSVHDMTVLGKAVTESFYGRAPMYSYWQGCSTGGRQGLMEAQMYPEDYDGIVAGAPAVNWNDFTPAQQWPQVVMWNERHAPAQCEFDAINAAAVAACDALDGVKDGIINLPGQCTFDPMSLAGKSYECDTDNKTHAYNTTSLTVAAKIYAGPTTLNGTRLWYGILPGTNFSSLAPTTTNSNGTVSPGVFEISDSWFRNYLFKNADAPTATISYADFVSLTAQSHMEYDSVMGTADADLSLFAARGGKLITWQGLADNLIMPNGTMDYLARVHALLPGADDFYRAFFAPGVGHCGGGTGAVPVDPLGALRRWVEGGVAPGTLSAAAQWSPGSGVVKAGVVSERDLCMWPMVEVYKGGDASKASSWGCA